MRSNARSEPLDLARDLPTTADDVEALRRVKTVRPLDLETYLRFLSQLPSPTLREYPKDGAPAPAPLGGTSIAHKKP